MLKTLNDIKKEMDNYEEALESFNNNPIKLLIQHLFSHEFSEHNYSNYSLDSMKQLIAARFDNNVHGKYKPIAQRMIKKIKKQESQEDILYLLNDYLFK
jgi:hypothetical protein